MKLYGKRFVRNVMQQVSQSKQETREGILWDVGPNIYVADRMCRVKIQGSNEYIHAYYPENWEKTPSWLKPGNAIRIMHIGGIRGRIEIIGHGQLVPTPVLGVSFPTVAIPVGAILSGCELIQAGAPRMVVLVRTGIYRIGIVNYILGPITMEYGTAYQLDDGGAMGEIAGAVAINPAPSTGNYRYDLIAVGDDGVIDYTAGIPSANPVKPTLAAGHVQLGPYVFVPYGTTEIYNGINIGGTFSVPVPTTLGMVIADNDLAWSELSTTVTVAVYDQYGQDINSSGKGWYLTLEIIQGNGKVSSPEEGESITKIGGHTGAGNSYVFTYIREHLNAAYPSWVTSTLYYVNDGVENDGSGYVCLIEHTSGTFADDLAAGKWEWQDDQSPVLQAKLNGTDIIVTAFIILRNINGDPM